MSQFLVNLFFGRGRGVNCMCSGAFPSVGETVVTRKIESWFSKIPDHQGTPYSTHYPPSSFHLELTLWCFIFMEEQEYHNWLERILQLLIVITVYIFSIPSHLTFDVTIAELRNITRIFSKEINCAKQNFCDKLLAFSILWRR